MGVEWFETRVLLGNKALLASALTELWASARGCTVGGAGGTGASSRPLAGRAQKLVLYAPGNAGSPRSRSPVGVSPETFLLLLLRRAMLANANISISKLINSNISLGEVCWGKRGDCAMVGLPIHSKTGRFRYSYKV
jgi:hypothetical protein